MRERLKKRIYASQTWLAVLVGLAKGGHSIHRGAVVSVVVTALSLWLATLVADLQAHPVAHGHRVTVREVGHALFTTGPLLSSALGRVAMIGLSAADLLEPSAALWVSVGSEVTALALWGFSGGRRVGAGSLRATVTSVLKRQSALAASP